MLLCGVKNTCGFVTKSVNTKHKVVCSHASWVTWFSHMVNWLCCKPAPTQRGKERGENQRDKNIYSELGFNNIPTVQHASHYWI